MRMWLGSTMAIAVAAALHLSAAEGKGLSVTIDGLPPGASVEIAMNAGKVGSTTTGAMPNALAAAMNEGKLTGTADGNGLLTGVLQVATSGKIELEVIVDEQCPDQKVRVYLVSRGQEPPPECKRRILGVFWLNKTRHLTIHLATGVIGGTG